MKQTGRWILEKEGRHALTPLRLAESAGVALSSVYEYFPNMDALIAAIFDDLRVAVREEFASGLAALPEDATLYDGIHFSVRLGLAAHYQRMRLDPDYSVRSTHFDELVRLDLVKTKRLWTACMTPALMQRFAAEVRVKDKRKAEFMVYQTLLALTRSMVLERPGYLKDEDSSVLIARMVHALLTTPETAE
ncbi:Bacterial regulatory protein, tetR family [compost metagenome]